jgi:hypothetical protein
VNARTSRLLRRVAYAMKRNDPNDTKALAGVKKAWNRTPRNERGAMRPTLVGIFHTIMGELDAQRTQ